MAEAMYYGDPDRIAKVATAAIASGEVLKLDDGRASVYQGLKAAETGDSVSLLAKGVFKVATAKATTFAVGDPVYWDASASLAVAASAALDGANDFYLGLVVLACTAAQSVVLVDLNANVPFRPMVKEIDTTAASEEFTLIPASMNPVGLVITEIKGLVTEVMGGGTEDQGIITVNDSDDNVLAILTPTDASADVLGDIIVGYEIGAATTGDASIEVAAGLSVYAKTTQLSSGTSAAGKVRVSIDAKPKI